MINEVSKNNFIETFCNALIVIRFETNKWNFSSIKKAPL